MVRSVCTKLDEKTYSMLLEMCRQNGHDTMYECVKTMIYRMMHGHSRRNTYSELEERVRKLEKKTAELETVIRKLVQLISGKQHY